MDSSTPSNDLASAIIGVSPTLPFHAGGRGIYQFSEGGRRFIDGSSGAMVSNLGHGNEAVIAAIEAQLRIGAFAYRLHFKSAAAEGFARALTERCPDGLDRCYLVSGGSEAVEATIKLARQAALATGRGERWKVIRRRPGYHGTTFGALSLTGYDPLTDPFTPFLASMPSVPAPICWRDLDGGSPEDAAVRAAEALDETIVAQGPESVLAFIMEPVGGASTGALTAPGIYYGMIRDICDRHGIYLIHDEVMSGAGRTGRFLGGDHWNCQPDFVVMSKGVSAGYMPLGAVIARTELAEAVVAAGGFQHGHTYAGNPLAAACGLAVLQEMDRLNVVANAATQGDRLLAGLKRLQERHPFIGDVRGKGLLTAIELVQDRETAAPFAPALRISEQIVNAAMEEDLILYERKSRGGYLGDHVMICPPLIVTRDEIDLILSKLDLALARVASRLRSGGGRV